jgi:signal peptidase I
VSYERRQPPAPKESTAAAGHKKSSITRTLVEIVIIVAAAFVIALLVQAFIVKPFTIHQISMRPTLEEGDRILLNRLSYHFREPARGDIIVLRSPVTDGEDLVKRIVAVAGDRVSVLGGTLYVNGAAQAEPYVLEQGFEGELPEKVIPAGDVFVMGDNRNNSGDSRLFGPISKDVIIGCAFCVYWPISRWKGL